MEQKSEGKLERLIRVLFGDNVDVEKEAENIREKRRKELKETYEASEKIMKLANKTRKDIPLYIYEEVAAQALMNDLKSFEGTREFSARVGKEIAIKEMREVSRTLQNAYITYSRLFSDNKMISSIGPDEYTMLKAALTASEEYYNSQDEESPADAVAVYAYSVCYYEVQRFKSKEEYGIEDAFRIIAADRICSLIREKYKPYNVLVAEKRIMEIERYNHYKKMDEKYNIPEVILRANTPAGAEENMEVFLGAAEEIDRVLNNAEESYGYKLNYIRSGNVIYDVWRWKGTIDNPDAETSEGTLWTEEIGSYDTLEEANQAAVPDEDGTPAEVQECDPEEMWAIVGPDGKNATEMIYPSKIRAAVFLIGVLGEKKVPNWYAWEKYLDERGKKK